MSALAITPQGMGLQLYTQSRDSLQTQDPARKPEDPARIHEAAEQFETLLLGQMLHSVRESSGNWLGMDDSSSGDSATDFAEQQFAATIASQGGLGLATLIAGGLSGSSPR